MPTQQAAVRPLTKCLRESRISRHYGMTTRAFSVAVPSNQEAAQEMVSYKPMLDPETVTSGREERKLMRSGVVPIGSRRRRAALRSSENIAFEQLPFHCFQEARKVLQIDRQQKLELIKKERLRISNLEALDASTLRGREAYKQKRLSSMKRHLEYLKIQADINDPMIKKRFEDGEGDMNKPIYRYLADKKWREYHRKVIVQRIEQLSIVPDMLPAFEPTASVSLAFRTHNVQPGNYVDSRISEVPPRLKVQVFDKGERLVSIVVIDGDVPDVDKDGFRTRCHFLAANIPLSPTQTSIPLSRMTDEQLVIPWLPPFAQKGSPYHRYSIFVLQQQEAKSQDVLELYRRDVERDDFSLRKYVNDAGRNPLGRPIGAAIFRAQWDEGTADVMERAGVKGADVVFKRKRVIALKPKEAPRGWDAKHAKAKYKPFMMGRQVRLRGRRR